MLQERKAPVNVVSVDNTWQEWWRIHPWKHMITPSHIVGMNTQQTLRWIETTIENHSSTSCSVSFGQGKRLLVSTVTERRPAPIHKTGSSHTVCEKTHGTSIVNRMITQTSMMWLNTWHQPRDSCELDLLGRMHPSESIGFPFRASYPRLSVWACISVMKAIIAHPLRQTRHWNTGSASCEHHQQFDSGYHRNPHPVHTGMTGAWSHLMHSWWHPPPTCRKPLKKRTWRHLSIRSFHVKPHMIQLLASFHLTIP